MPWKRVEKDRIQGRRLGRLHWRNSGGHPTRAGLVDGIIKGAPKAPLMPWFGAGGEGSLQVPRVVKRRYVLCGEAPSMGDFHHRPGVCNRGAQRASLPSRLVIQA